MTVGFKLYFPDPQTTFLHAFDLGSRFFTLFFPLRHQPQSCPQWQKEVGRACACKNVRVFHCSRLGFPVPFESFIINTVRGVIDEVGRNCPTISNFSVWIKKLYHFEIPFCFLFFHLSRGQTILWLFLPKAQLHGVLGIGPLAAATCLHFESYLGQHPWASSPPSVCQPSTLHRSSLSTWVKQVCILYS